MRNLVLLVFLASASGCHPGRDPERLLGRWQNGQDRLEFLPGGVLRFHSSMGQLRGTYARETNGEIRVDLGSHTVGGSQRLWYAMGSGDQLGLCELRNARHCLRFARPGSRVEVLPR